MSRCRVCGRALRSALSIQRGVGPTCANQVRSFVQVNFQEEPVKLKDYSRVNQWIKKAEELLAKEKKAKKSNHQLNSIEQSIKNNNFETGYVFDKKGRVIWEQKGGSNYVDVSDAINKGLLKGNVFTHNHPRGTAFSFADIHIMIKYEVKEMRAVGSEHQYSMKLNEKAFPKNSTLEEKCNIVKSLYDKYNKDVRRDFTSKIRKGEMTIEFAESNHQHEVWSRVIAEKKVLKYERKKWND